MLWDDRPLFGREQGRVALVSRAAAHFCNLNQGKALLKVLLLQFRVEGGCFLIVLDHVATEELSWRSSPFPFSSPLATLRHSQVSRGYRV